MIYSIVQKSQLGGANRLDAEYYQPEYLDLISKLKSRDPKFLSDLSKSIICGPFGSEILQEDYREEGIPLIRVGDLNNWFVREDSLIFIESSLSQKLRKHQVFDGDLAVSQRGTIAMFSKVTDKFSTWNISANLISIKKSGRVDFDYLLAYLNSKYGIKQLYQRLSGQVQPKITTDDIKEILVLVPKKETQEAISELVREGWVQLGRSKSLYSQAGSLLLEELGLKDFKIGDELSYIVDSSDIESAHRADAEYFQPKYNQILKKLARGKIDALGENFELIKSKNFSYAEDGEIGVIKTKQLGKRFIDFNVESRVEVEVLKNEKLPILEDRDVLFASMGVGSLGKTNIFYKFETEDEDYTVDSTLRIFRQKDKSKIKSEVLEVFLGSFIGQELIYKHIVGTSGIISIYDGYLQNFPIPILPNPTQQKIANLVHRSHQARKKAEQLLEEAKTRVEEMIEEGVKGEDRSE